MNDIRQSLPSLSWGDLCSCCEDCAGCLYVLCCPCCALCDIGSMLGPNVVVGPKNEPAPIFMGCGGQCLHWMTIHCGIWGILCGLCICPDKTCCRTCSSGAKEWPGW